MKSKVRIGTSIQIGKDHSITIENLNRFGDQLPETEREKISSKLNVYCRVNVNMLKALRLGKFLKTERIFKISHFPEQILKEHIELKNSLKSKLQVCSICSVRNRSKK